MSQKPQKASEEEKKKGKRKKKSNQPITRAVTPLRWLQANAGKLSALDALMSVYLKLCQQYTTLLCEAESLPDKWSEPVFATELAERWQPVAMQQAARIAQSLRTNRATAYQAYLQDVAAYEEAKAQAEAAGQMASFKRQEPTWADGNLPVLGVPVKLAPDHKKALAGKTLNTSTTLAKRKGSWWLTLSFDEAIPLQTATDAPLVGGDVGIANFVTTSTGQSYATFHGALARKHRHDRRKRRNKAKLRACLQKKGVPKAQLPSTGSATGQRLSRHVRQQINRAINQVLDAHAEARLVYENLSVACMRFHARSLNASLYASQLGHLPEQLAWAAAKRGMAAHRVNPADSWQECPRCHFVSRANRPAQQTLRCVVCGYQAHAAHKAALVLAARWGDQALAACKTKEAVKALLLQRHDSCKQAQAEHNTQRVQEIGPALQLSFWDDPERFLEISGKPLSGSREGLRVPVVHPAAQSAVW